jgi:hypothetical protein
MLVTQAQGIMMKLMSVQLLTPVIPVRQQQLMVKPATSKEMLPTARLVKQLLVPTIQASKQLQPRPVIMTEQALATHVVMPVTRAPIMP